MSVPKLIDGREMSLTGDQLYGLPGSSGANPTIVLPPEDAEVLVLNFWRGSPLSCSASPLPSSTGSLYASAGTLSPFGLPERETECR